MIEDSALLAQRGELKRQLEAGAYKTLSDMILDETGRLIQKLTQSHEPPPVGVSAVIVFLVTLAIGALTSLVAGELNPATRDDMTIVIGFGTVVFALVSMILARNAQRILLGTLRDHLLGAIETQTDLVDLQRWLAATYSMRKQVLFDAALGTLMTAYVVGFVFALAQRFIGFGITVLSLVNAFQSGTLIYLFFFAVVSFCARLSRYQLKLYATDPGSSGIIRHLSGMIQSQSFIGAVFSSLYTVFYASIGELTLPTVVALVIVGWGPALLVFVTGQRALTKAIARGKQDTLDGIQARIDELTTEGDIAEKATTDAMNRLMDLHDRIKAARGSALDFRAGLGFLNSLLLPLIAFLLSNLDQVLEFFR